MIRVRQSKEKEERREEQAWARFRIQWADFRNANAGRNSLPVKPQDLIRLSFDKDEGEQKPLSFKEAKALLGGRIKKK